MLRNKNFGKCAFAATLLLAVVVQMSLVLYPIIYRDMPVELDDALVYEVKAAEMNGCFLQDCQGLVSLKEQLDIGASESVDWPKFRMARSFLDIYHPGHSAILVGLKKLGLSWEAAFDLLRIAGSLLIIGGIAYWAYAFFGLATASVFYVFFAVTLFPEQGIHIVSPGNLTTGFGFLLFGLIARGGRFLELALTLGSAIMLSWHSISIVLVPVIWAFYFIHQGWPMHRRAVIGAGISAVLVVLTFGAQKFIDVPMFHLPISYKPNDATFLQQVIENARFARSTVHNWFSPLNIGPIAIYPVALFCLWGLTQVSAEKRRGTLTFAALLIASLLGGLFMVFPAHPGLMFDRIWIFAAAFGLGLFAQAFLGLFQRVVALRHDRSGGDGDTDSRRSDGTNSTVIISAFVLFSVLSVLYFADGAVATASELLARAKRHDYNLSAQQIDQLMARADANSRVFYFTLNDSEFSSRVPMLYYFTHGAMYLDAYTDFIPAPEGAHGIPEVDFAVGWNPLMALPGSRRQGLQIKPDETLVFEVGEPAPAHAVHMNLSSESSDATVVIEVFRGDVKLDEIEVAVEGAWTSPFASLASSFDSLRVSAHVPVDLSGLKLVQSDNNNWPWGKDRSIAILPANGSTLTQSLDLSDIQALHNLQPGCTPSVLNDSGALILLKLSNCPYQL